MNDDPTDEELRERLRNEQEPPEESLADYEAREFGVNRWGPL